MWWYKRKQWYKKYNNEQRKTNFTDTVGEIHQKKNRQLDESIDK